MPASCLLAPVARGVLTLHLLPSLLLKNALGALLWTSAALAAAVAAAAGVRCRRQRSPSLVCLYTCCTGGYHSDLRAARSSLAAVVAAGAPEMDWPRLPRFTLYFDDQVNFPAECCRAALGYVVAVGCQDPQRAADAWRAHPLVSCHGLRVGVLPEGPALAVDLLHASGPLAYLLSLVAAMHCLRTEVRAAGVHSQVPGLLEVSDPSRRRLSFLLPLEARQDLLPF